jgi:glycine/D-amino acid oxidase-like deaminating enzyme
VLFEIDQPLTRLSGMIGRAKAEQAWRRSRLSIESLAVRISELGITCGVERRPSLYLAGNALGPPGLRDEADARRQAGIDAGYLAPAALKGRFGIVRDAAIVSRGNLSLDPRKLTAGLLLKALERGARYYAPTEATAIKGGRSEVTIATKDGPTVTAGHAVLATGYELTDIVPATRHQIVSTWAIATKRQPRAVWPEESFVWEASDPYLYMRATKDGRVICGGEDEDFSDEKRRDALIATKSARLSQKLQKLFPGLDPQAEFAWAGSFGTTTTGLPYIGSLPGHPRVHAVMGYGGNGITYSRIAAEIVTTAIDGRDDCDAHLFLFKR